MIQDHPRGCGEHHCPVLRSRASRRIIPADAGSTVKNELTHDYSPDHPRGCGEHRKINRLNRHTQGSSPRMRGAPACSSSTAWARRIIPADAGSTMPRPILGRPLKDHPRGCGEHRTQGRQGRQGRGSSPRMRGAPSESISTPVSARIIPADAGSTVFASVRNCGHRDHPRGCGEHRAKDSIKALLQGSSPRMRGAPWCESLQSCKPGIIPADAGSTQIGRVRHTRTRDHPRGCGEHKDTNSIELKGAGSSPRMRGALTLGQQGCLEHGIIPADAGSTRSWPTTRWRTEDHPRGCGEHFRRLNQSDRYPGSSPRMRGAHTRGTGRAHPDGIIPADAGSTVMSLIALSPWRDHPRGCGEHTCGSDTESRYKGSSPRMRGAP